MQKRSFFPVLENIWRKLASKKFEIIETFGSDIVKSVLNGGHYIRAKKGILFLRFSELFVNQGVVFDKFKLLFP